jgi:acyl-CoA synthetase (AMP-forming)/AMP-acid ligase II
LEEAHMSISMLLDLAVEQYGDRIALGGLGSGISYPALDRLSKAGAADLRADESQSLAFVGVNGPTVPLLLFSAARAGVPFVPLNYRLSSGALCGLLGELDRPRVIADESFAAALTGLGGLPTARSGLPALRRNRPSPPRRQRSCSSPVARRQSRKACCCGTRT